MSTTGSEDATAAVNRPPSYEETGATSAGTNVGRYVVLEEVGRGAMGRVLRAYDPKLQREVALKELRCALVREETTLRLVAEARAMAKLSHPNVVAVYDVEEIEDDQAPQLTIVMEYVAGQTLRAWLEHEDHPWQRTVESFIAAGRGLAAAHAAGLLHRDFKPANVLVSADGSSIKVTDFGLAKGAAETLESIPGSATGVSPEEGLTRDGAVVGTPRYMAPEQHAGDTLTPSADQYAFCVALWEALCAVAPFSGGDLDRKKANGPPTWPDKVVVPPPIVAAVCRGLSADPDERWPRMEALLEALAYEASRRRSRWALGLSGLTVVGIAVGGWQSWAATRAERCSGAQQHLQDVWGAARRGQVEAAMLGTELPHAPWAWESTQLKLDEYAQAWAAMHTEACEATTVRGEQSVEVMDLRMACLHRAKMELDATASVLGIPDPDIVTNAHKLVGGLARLSACADIEALRADVEPPRRDQEGTVDRARALLAQAKSERTAGRYSQGQAHAAEAEALLVDVDYVPVHIELALEQGRALGKLGRYEEAEVKLTVALAKATSQRQFQEMLEASSQLLYVVGYQQRRPDEALSRYRMLAENLADNGSVSEIGVRNNLASVLYAQGKYEESEEQHRRALEVRQKTLGANHPSIKTSRNNLAIALNAQGKYEEAEQEHRQALAILEKTVGPKHPELATSWNNLGKILYTQGRHDEAEREFRRALAVRDETLGPGHPDTASTRNNLAVMLQAQGKHEEAEDVFRQMLALTQEALGPDHPVAASARNNLAASLLSQGRYDDAQREFRRVLEIREKVLGSDHPDVLNSRTNLGAVLYAQGRYEEAEEEHRRALTMRQKTLGVDHPSVALSRNSLAKDLNAQGKYEEAEREFRRGLSLWQKTLPAEHPNLAANRTNLAGVLLELGNAHEALELAEQAWVRRQRDDIPPKAQAMAAFVLAQALWRTGGDEARRRRTRSLAERAIEAFGRAGEAHAGSAEEVKVWLRRVDSGNPNATE